MAAIYARECKLPRTTETGCWWLTLADLGCIPFVLVFPNRKGAKGAKATFDLLSSKLLSAARIFSGCSLPPGSPNWTLDAVYHLKLLRMLQCKTLDVRGGCFRRMYDMALSFVIVSRMLLCMIGVRL
jgi:hypothetical protein